MKAFQISVQAIRDNGCRLDPKFYSGDEVQRAEQRLAAAEKRVAQCRETLARKRAAHATFVQKYHVTWLSGEHA